MEYAATIHSIERMKERIGINSRKAAIRISKAVQRGKSADDFSSWERNYLKDEGYDGCKAIAYDGFCYIVNSDGVCVTLYPLPAWFGKKKRFDGKERIRDAKKYYNESKKMNCRLEDFFDFACAE